MAAAPHPAGRQPFKCQRWRQALGLAGRPPATDQRGGYTEQPINQRSRAIPLQVGRCASKVAASQVPTEQAQGQCCQRRAQRDAGPGADQPQRERLPQHQRQPVASAQAQHAKQGKLLCAFGDA